MVECKSCGEEKPEEEFYKSNKSRCKPCVRQAVRVNRAEKIDYYREYDRQRFQKDPKVRARHKRYRDTPSGKMAMLRARTKWLKKNPVARAAHTILSNAVRDGRIQKPGKCTECGQGGRIHGHHDDYTKPLEVRWVCQKCHWKIHRNEQ